MIISTFSKENLSCELSIKQLDIQNKVDIDFSLLAQDNKKEKKKSQDKNNKIEDNKLNNIKKSNEQSKDIKNSISSVESFLFYGTSQLIWSFLLENIKNYSVLCLEYNPLVVWLLNKNTKNSIQYKKILDEDLLPNLLEKKDNNDEAKEIKYLDFICQGGRDISKYWNKSGIPFVTGFYNYCKENYKSNTLNFLIKNQSISPSDLCNIVCGLIDSIFLKTTQKPSKCSIISKYANLNKIEFKYQDKQYSISALNFYNEEFDIAYNLDASTVLARLIIYIACLQQLSDFFKENKQLILPFSLTQCIFLQVLQNKNKYKQLYNLNEEEETFVELEYSNTQETTRFYIASFLFDATYKNLFKECKNQEEYILNLNEDDQNYEKIKLINLNYGKRHFLDKIFTANNANNLNIKNLIIYILMQKVNKILEKSEILNVSKENIKYIIIKELLKLNTVFPDI
jgi:hypothetical protein